jgi:hypothetical protein
MKANLDTPSHCEPFVLYSSVSVSPSMLISQFVHWEGILVPSDGLMAANVSLHFDLDEQIVLR